MGESEEDDDFKYIVRLVDTDLDGGRPMKTALTDVKGVGQRVARVLCRELGVDPEMKCGHLSDAQVETLRELVQTLEDQLPGWMVNRPRDHESGQTLHLVGTDVDMYRRDDINRLQKISCYRGVRHQQGQKVRGQRTRSNGRSGLALGVSRAEQQKKAAQADQED